MNPHHQQYETIQSMLAAGHRSVHLERHSLLLVGGVGGFLSVATEWVITDSLFPGTAERGLALLVWLSFWLGGMSLLDYGLTRRARAQRDETLPFAQAQITRAWWMLLSVGCLGSFAMGFYGGGAMIYALWTVLLGLGVYLFGLFSRSLIEWIGLATILLGVLGLIALNYGATRWLTASVFAIGLPLAGWLNVRVDDARSMRRLLALIFWLAVVVTPPLLVSNFSSVLAPVATPVASAAAVGTGEQVLRLEAGTRVPLRVNMKSPLLSIPGEAELAMTLSMPIEVALLDGKPDGRYRIGAGPWYAIHDGMLHLRVDRLSPSLEDAQPVVRAYAQFDGAAFEGETP